MVPADRQERKSRLTFVNLLRLIFVLFSLYLMGDAFNRWDGFRFYAPLSEFLPSVGLASILWSILAVAAAVLIWVLLKITGWVLNRIGTKARVEHLLFFTGVLLLMGGAAWKVKNLFWFDVQTSLQLKAFVFVCVVMASVLLARLLRNRCERWIQGITAGVTPLVWIFGAFVILSIPLVTYHTWFKITERVFSQEAGRVTVEGENPRNMSLYGYRRETTPFISEWAKKATVFTRAEAESNFTAPTTASLVTGKRVWTHLRYHRMSGSRPVRTYAESMPLLLKKNGYFNMAFITNPIATVENLGIPGSFNIAPKANEFWRAVDISGKVTNFLAGLFAERIRLYGWIWKEDFIFGKLLMRLQKDISFTRFPPEMAFNELLTAIEENSQEPFFAWIHLDPPHYPYLPFEPYMGMFDSSERMRTFKSMQRERVSIDEHLSRYQDLPESIGILRARYDEFIRYCDSQFKDFVEALESGKRLDNTVLILSTDHGEIFEHKRLFHGSTLYEPETNIPLIIREPKQTMGRTVDSVVEQIDIPATIMEFAKIQVPLWMEGRSLIPLIRGENVPPKAAFSMNLESSRSVGHEITKGVVAVWKNDFKLIHYLEDGRSELYDLKDDPDERKNIFKERPGVGEELLGLILDNLEQANEKIRKS
jgi:arylsulfatase A-like enzyme